MKKLMLIIFVVAGILIYQRCETGKNVNKSSERDQKVLSIQGRVDGNLSLLGRSAYRLIDLKDSTKSYYVVGSDEVPSIGEVINARLEKRELAIFNDGTLAVYTELSKEVNE